MNYDQMETAELKAALEDAIGESQHCGDDDCGCHRVPRIIRDELEWRKQHGEA